MSLDQLKADVETAKTALAIAETAIETWKQLPENNVFASLEAAEELEEDLLERASTDCEGSYNCGLDVYEQKFIVDGKQYTAKLSVEYNRHDKTYYYVEESEFTIS